MRNLPWAVALALAALCGCAWERGNAQGVAELPPGATELREGASFTFADVPERLAARVPPGRSVHFLLEENATTGYMWVAAYPTNACAVALEHRAAEAPRGFCGAPGKVAIAVSRNAAANGPVPVEFTYERCWEKNRPAKRVRLVLLP